MTPLIAKSEEEEEEEEKIKLLETITNNYGLNVICLDKQFLDSSNFDGSRTRRQNIYLLTV